MGWYEALKDAVTAAEHLKDAELKHKLAAVQVECARLAEENAQLREERNQLREQLTLKTALVFRENVYWMQAEGGSEQGPFCPKCWDGSAKTARMIDRSDDEWWTCALCDRTIQKPGKGRAADVPDYRGRNRTTGY